MQELPSPFDRPRLDPFSEPRAKAMQLMLALATLIDGFVAHNGAERERGLKFGAAFLSLALQERL